jgi:hypothetical protein
MMKTRTALFVVTLLTCLTFAASAFAVDIDALNAKIKAKGGSWVAGETSVSKMPLAERQKLYAFDLTPPKDASIVNYSMEAPKDMPTELDWRNIDGKDFSTPIKQQHPCGTCQTFCFMAAVEAMLKITMDNPFIEPDFSEQHVYSCDGPVPYTLFHPAIYMKSSGAADEACQPYDCESGYRAPCTNKCEDWEDRSVKITDWQFFMFPDPETLKGLLQAGPIVAGFQVFSDFETYTEGIYEHVEGNLLGGHGVAIFGYGEDDKGGYWICKNSWGTEWGEQGWFKIRWGTGLLGFGYQSMSITVTMDSLCGNNTAPALSGFAAMSTAEILPDGESLEVTFDYVDAEANLAGGELFFSIDGQAAQRFETPMVELVGTTSSDSKTDRVYAIAGPFTGKEHTLDIYVVDLCGAASNEVSLTFVADGEPADDDDNDSQNEYDKDDDDDAGCGC